MSEYDRRMRPGLARGGDELPSAARGAVGDAGAAGGDGGDDRDRDRDRERDRERERDRDRDSDRGRRRREQSEGLRHKAGVAQLRERHCREQEHLARVAAETIVDRDETKSELDSDYRAVHHFEAQ